ncbi:methionyl-tRNA formyltransferase [Legionella oakridgensis]|uniref:Methionyl-tRNA formyltransferase n=2 Tax=Legionella oakridgensis TaxID=29423 RepID=W0B6J7_9GAMM|nr:methionyl-tRNA formyltransferase [Legionella oakridgensis]AHE66168.1 methionyl-tRNA formyltransferase [Legionella oakridgensis ATCC 33761 = DSM 21215]ETO94031.1 methionyl-tRNA formyltransferase [Legionella oakridgensis RV-2-2007]KTD43908.1 methionyl tRNA formyltransferase [Legionella oakridgensis]STY16076.1 methionyl-tRNA formyltransferase [Legionella longbeachae]
MKSLKIVFAGTPEFALPCLDALAASEHQLEAVYTQPDRPAGRGRQMQASAVKQWAETQHVPVYQPLNFKTPQAIDELAMLAPDILVVIAYGLILPQAVLNIPPLGCINVHASLLPRWRGASPIQHALLHGDTQTGVTIMQMDVGMDTGDMLAKATYTIQPEETAGSLHDHLAKLAVAPLMKSLENIALGKSIPQSQDHAAATYAPKINKEDANIHWQRSAIEIERQIRAFNPWPIAYTQAEDITLRIHQARALHESCEETPGTILSLDKKGIKVATGKQVLLVERIQFPGGKAMTIADWLNAPRAQLHKQLVLR